MTVLEQIPKDWQGLLTTQKIQLESVLAFTEAQRKKKIIYPDQDHLFYALACTSPQKVKVIILGQDPYHRENQAMGLSFSVSIEEKIPPSLLNIYKELQSDIGIDLPNHGDLTQWANQGVLLLNTILTVTQHSPGSHKDKGWEEITDYIIASLSKNHSHLVFLLWGAFAQKKESIISNPTNHLILKSPHPSPLSAYRGFLGSQHFSKTNQYLIKHQKSPIDWQIK